MPGVNSARTPLVWWLSSNGLAVRHENAFPSAGDVGQAVAQTYV
jgi:hypothetical protein